ncbi:MAG TPA: hypothetical protein VF039_08885 [Longimicrobiales bacterium]
MPRFNVSDALDVPLRGFLLRLRHTAGDVSVKDLGPGSQLLLRSPDGAERTVTIVARSLTGGRNTQARLEKSGQLDLIISAEDAYQGGRAVGVGWSAEGPVRGEGGKPIRGKIAQVRHARPAATRDSGTGGWPFNPPSGR